MSTRCDFEVAAHDQGGHVTFIDQVSSQLGHKASLIHTSRVSGRMFDGIEWRGFHRSVVEARPVRDRTQVVAEIRAGADGA